jgi:hypothetical protein
MCTDVSVKHTAFILGSKNIPNISSVLILAWVVLPP